MVFNAKGKRKDYLYNFFSGFLFLYNTGHKWLDISESSLTKKKEEQTSKVSSHVPIHTHLQMNQQLSTWLLI